VAAVVLGAVLWGLSGTAASALFARHHVSPGGLVAIRMTVSGFVLLTVLALRRGIPVIWAPLRDSFATLVIFAVLGLLVVQYTYLLAIAASNAATATLLQYLAPAMVVVYVALQSRTLPASRTVAALLLTLVGTSLLVTGGSFTHMALTPLALTFGLLSALALAFYSLYPVKLLRAYGALPVVAWGLLLGGLALTVGLAASGRPFLPAHLDLPGLELVAFVIFFGTLLPFPLYLGALNRLSPTFATILSAAEPLAAAVASVLWLHLRLSPLEWTGGAGIAAGVLLMAGTVRRASLPQDRGRSGSHPPASLAGRL
jgi:drug/metabolite transporter (DMT)-like permease